MADVQTTDINTKPTVAAIDSNDQIFISDGGTALKKISYTNLAKAIIEQYNASQLAGATKTIQSAFNELNSNLNNKGVWYELLGSKTENGNYTLNASYAEYKSVVVMLFGLGNSIASCIYPTTMLITAGYHPTVEVNSNKVEIEFTSATNVTVSGLSGSVRIYGIR